MKKRIGSSLLVALLIGSMFAPTIAMASPTVNELKEEKKEAQNEVASLQSELTQIIEKINKLESDLVAKGEEIQKAEADLKVAEEQEKKQYEDMKLRIKFMYESGDSDALEAIFESETFTDMLNRAEYVQHVHNYDREMLDEYVATKKKIEELKSGLETELANLESMQSEFESEKESLDKTLEEKKAEVANIEEELQAAIAEAEEERRRQEEAANAGNGGNGGSGGHYTGTGNPAVGSAIVSAAASYLGVPYVWGGTSASGVDCSGLVYLAHKKVGISVTRYSGSLGANGKAVSASEAMPGDVVCYNGHVGIYVGGGQMIHAPRPGQSVCYVNVNYKAHWFRRYW